ncbi:MAG: ATP-binding protein [bacterium]
MGDGNDEPTAAELRSQENYLLVEALHEASRRYRHLVDQLHDAVFECEPDGMLSFVNPAWKEHLGLEAGDFRGKSLYDFVDRSDVEFVRGALDTISQAPEITSGRSLISHEKTRDGLTIQRGIHFQRLDGSPVQLEMSAQKTASGSIIGSLHDVSDRDHLEDQLLVAKEQAEQSDIAKGLFMAKTSHELRTPLNIILGFAEMLDDDHIDSEERGLCLSRLTLAARQLLGLVNDILDITQAERDALRIDLQEFSPAVMAEEVYSLFAEQVRRAGTPFQMELSSRLVNGIVSDPLRVRQILINLVDNAIKHAGDGGICVCVANSMIRGQPAVAFRVSDTGAGIPAAYLEWIFGEFNQLNLATKGGEIGVGLGLAVGRRLARLLEGELDVHSTPGEGSSFELKLPLAHSAADQGSLISNG